MEEKDADADVGFDYLITGDDDVYDGDMQCVKSDIYCDQDFIIRFNKFLREQMKIILLKREELFQAKDEYIYNEHFRYFYEYRHRELDHEYTLLSRSKNKFRCFRPW